MGTFKADGFKCSHDTMRRTLPSRLPTHTLPVWTHTWPVCPPSPKVFGMHWAMVMGRVGVSDARKPCIPENIPLRVKPSSTPWGISHLCTLKPSGMDWHRRKLELMSRQSCTDVQGEKILPSLPVKASKISMHGDWVGSSWGCGHRKQFCRCSTQLNFHLDW